MEEFYRIRRLPPYVFEQVNRAKAAARNAGADIIDMGMGNPDLPTPPHVIEKLKETLGKPRTDRYSASRGINGLRKAQATYYDRRFGVKLNPDTQVVATLGSKEGFANVAQAITAPGDVVLCPNPSYPIHAFGFLMAGGVIRSVPSEPTPEFFPAVERAIIHSIPKPIALVVCYPSNPTAYVADLDFYKDLVAFAKKHEIFILSDLAYAEVYFDDKNPPPSVLQVPGAMDVTVEFTSMSKTYSMAGWRIGFAVGNERIIAALARVKSYLDYGAFTPIQVAATAALNGPDDCIRETRDTYKRRRDVLVESFGRAGWDIPAPRASMFAWAPLPEPFRTLDTVEFSTLLIEKAEIAVSPGIGFGEHGEGFVRIALVENEQRIRQAARNLRRFLETGPEKLHNVVPLAKRRCPALHLATRAGQAFSGICPNRGRFMVAPLKLGIAGLGTVGAAVVRLIAEEQSALVARTDRRIAVVAVTARSKGKKRNADLRKIRWVTDPQRLAVDPEIDVFVELMGGDGDPARSAVEAALAAGKSVVTANKALLARHGVRLAELAEKNGVALNFEAAVGGAIPIVKTLREGLAGNSFARIYGILNGTCNYILTRMEQEKLSFAACLKDAQRLGYAEADPTFDVEGFDTAQKLAILASIAFGTRVNPEAVFVEGISSIAPEDLEAAAGLGYRVKLLGVAVKTEQGIEQRVHPTMVPRETAIAQVMGVTNAVTVDAEGINPITLVGPGAGGAATASAVVSDIGDIARGVRTAPFGRPSTRLTTS